MLYDACTLRRYYFLFHTEKESFCSWNPRIIHENASCHQRYQYPSYMIPFQQCIGKTEPNQGLSHGSQNKHFSSSLEDLHHLPSVRNKYTILSPPESPFGISGSSRPIAAASKWSCKSNVASAEFEFLISSSQGYSPNEVAMASTPPLQALQSLCRSITSDDFTAQATEDVLCPEDHSKCARNSQFELTSVSQETVSQVIIPEILQSITVLPQSFVQAETPDLWRPWDYEGAR